MRKEGIAQAAAAAAELINNLRREILAWIQAPDPVILTTGIPAGIVAFVLPQDWSVPRIPYLFIPFNNAIAPWRDVSLTRPAKGGMVMITKAFWTSKRLEATSKVLLNLFQAFVIACIISGVLDRITSVKMRIGFLAMIVICLIVGIILADNQNKKEI